jgi:hypothetical protein
VMEAASDSLVAAVTAAVAARAVVGESFLTPRRRPILNATKLKGLRRRYTSTPQPSVG